MVLLTPPSQRSPAPASTATGSPTHQVSRPERIRQPRPAPSVPTSLSTSFSSFSPVLPSKEQDASPTESLQTPGDRDQTPGTQPHPPSLSSPLYPYPYPETSKHPAVLALPPPHNIIVYYEVSLSFTLPLPVSLHTSLRSFLVQSFSLRSVRPPPQSVAGR